MRAKTEEMMERVKAIIIDIERPRAAEIAERCGLSKGSVYAIIRKLRLSGWGVYAAKDGYVPSEVATKRDDVHFLRQLNGRRAGDVMALQAAEYDIRRRWKTIADKSALKEILAPLTTSAPRLKRATTVLLTYKDKKGL